MSEGRMMKCKDCQSVDWHVIDMGEDDFVLFMCSNDACRKLTKVQTDKEGVLQFFELIPRSNIRN